MIWSILDYIDSSLLGGWRFLPIGIDVLFFVCGIAILVGSGVRKGYGSISLVLSAVMMMVTPVLYLVVGMGNGVGAGMFFVSTFVSVLNALGVSECRNVLSKVIFWLVICILGLVLFCSERSCILVAYPMLLLAIIKTRMFQRRVRDIVLLSVVLILLAVLVFLRGSFYFVGDVAWDDFRYLGLGFGIILSAIFCIWERWYILAFLFTLVLSICFGAKGGMWILSCALGAVFLFYPMVKILDLFLNSRYFKWGVLAIIMSVVIQMNSFFDYILLASVVSDKAFLYGARQIMDKDDYVLECSDFNPIVSDIEKIFSSTLNMCEGEKIEVDLQNKRKVYVIGRGLREVERWGIIKGFYRQGYRLINVFYNYVLDPMGVLVNNWVSPWYIWLVEKDNGRGSCDEQDSCSAQA